MLRDQQATNPSKPWYMWFCPGANHAPHHSPQEYTDKYKGMFDDGYEAYREWVLARMIDKGVLPEGTELTPLNPMPDDVAATPATRCARGTRSTTTRRGCSRGWPRCTPGFSEYTDAQVGRIVDYLERTGQLDNTVIFYCADNGASGEGSPNGSVNENKFFNGYPDELSENLKYLDVLGSPDTYNHYPTGWAVAFSTPFQMFKRYSQYSGGTCDPMVIHWPKGIKAKGEVRHQYHHATDIVRDHPRRRRSRDAEDLPRRRAVPARRGVDALQLRRREAPTTKKRQYYAMLGTRGIWEDGWKAAAMHAPISGVGHFDEDEWELYHVDEDRSESKDLAAEHPGEAQGAHRRLVRGGREELRAAARRPHRRRACWPSSGRSPSRRAKPLRLLSRNVAGARGRRGQHPRPVLQDHRRRRRSPTTADGVIFAHGSRFGGHALFIKDRKLHYVYNFLGIKPEQEFVSEELTPGKHALGMEFTREKAGEHGESLGTTTLYVDDQAGCQGTDAGAGGQVHALRRRAVRRLRQRRQRQPAVQEPGHLHRRHDPRRRGGRRATRRTSTSSAKRQPRSRATRGTWQGRRRRLGLVSRGPHMRPLH